MDGLVLRPQVDRADARDNVAASGRIDRHARADGQVAFEMEQAFEHDGQVADVAAVDAHRLELGVERAVEWQAQLDARPAVEESLLGAERKAVDRLLANDGRSRRSGGRFADLKDVLKMVVIEE